MNKIVFAVLMSVALMAESAVAQEYKAGNKIQVNWNGSWYSAIVKSYNAAKKCWNIHYEGYSDSWDECVGKKRIK